jgi:ABC-type sugar transport system ATPase subunit
MNAQADRRQGATEEAAPLIALEGIDVSFGGTHALSNAAFHVRPGEIVGLLGHNGAGKSTLVKVATGALRPDRGTMTVLDQPVVMRGEPRQMEPLGVKVIHQDPALTPNLSVYDNITLGRPEERASRGDRRRFAREALALLGAQLEVDRPVSTLSFGQRQIVDLARALSTNLQVLFLDEPTGALGKRETENLHALLRKLAADGRGIVYVSHRLRDILEVCTRIVALQGGRVMFNRPANAFTLGELSEALSPGVMRRNVLRTAPTTTSGGLDVELHGQTHSFAHGEVVGLFGMAAGPQFRFLEQLYGIAGSVTARLDGVSFTPRSPRGAIRRGVYYVSADRERDGLLPEMSALDNLVLPWLELHTRLLLLSHVRAARVFREAQKTLNVRGGHMDASAGALSGGNRQKLVVGRWLLGRQPSVLLLSQPTQGVDVGARTDIAIALRRLAEQQVIVLVASSEADEIALLCDRAIICDTQTWFASPRSERWEERLLEGLVTRNAA